MNIICMGIGSYHRYEDVRRLGATQKTPEALRIRARQGYCNGQGTTWQEVIHGSRSRQHLLIRLFQLRADDHHMLRSVGGPQAMTWVWLKQPDKQETATESLSNPRSRPR